VQPEPRGQRVSFDVPEASATERHEACDEEDASSAWVLCKVREKLVGFPVGTVVEVMRALPVEPLAGAPASVLGLAVVRGEPTPVVDLGALVEGGATGEPQPWGRFVTVRAGTRRVALAVEAVVDVRRLPRTRLGALPPLLAGTAASPVAAVAALDTGLLYVLRAAHMAPEEVWSAAERAGAGAGA